MADLALVAMTSRNDRVKVVCVPQLTGMDLQVSTRAPGEETPWTLRITLAGLHLFMLSIRWLLSGHHSRPKRSLLPTPQASDHVPHHHRRVR